jgi:hypothetical protein
MAMKNIIDNNPKRWYKTKKFEGHSLIERLGFDNYQLVVAESNAGVCPPLIHLAN